MLSDLDSGDKQISKTDVHDLNSGETHKMSSSPLSSNAFAAFKTNEREKQILLFHRNCCVEQQRERAAEVGPRREETHQLLFPFKVIAVAHPNNKG